MKKHMTLMALLVCGSVAADTFYLHADMVANDTPNDKTLWWTDPVGGTTQDALGAPTAGNRFDVNGRLFRSQNSSGSASFDGTVVVGTTGSAADPGFLLYTGAWNAYAMDVGSHLLVRPHQATTTMALQDLAVGAGADLAFRTLTGNNNVTLSTANISGSGTIQFGTTGYDNDTNALWTLSITDATPGFSGAISLVRGQLTFGSAFALDDARLMINSAENNGIVLANHVSFGIVTFGGAVLPVGTYTATEANTALGTDRFSGAGSLTAVLGANEEVHPHLLFSAADLPGIRQKVQSGWLNAAFNQMKSNADTYMAVSTNPYPISGPGNGYATAGRAIGERVNTLALTGMILEDSTYTTQAIDICMSAIAQTDVDDFASYNDHLSVGDALHAYAVAYDWLYNDMNSTQRSALRAEILEFGNWMYNYSIGGGYYGQYSPTPLSCNHNSVAHSGLGLAALATSSHAEWRDLAVRQIGGYFQYARDATGWNYEGIGYYGYGSLGAVPFSIAYHREGFPDLVAAESKNYLIPEWILRFVQPWGSSVVALNDSPERLAISSGMMHLLRQSQNGVGLWAWLKMFGPDGDGSYGGPVGGYIGDGCTLPYIILFADETLQPVSPADAGLPLGEFFARGGGSFRSSWQDDAALATFTCGFDQHRGHNHRDENSFTLSAFGEYFAVDPGYMPNMTRAHNTILVDGLGQNHEPDEYDAYGQVLDTQDFGGAWYMKGEAVEAYTNSIGLERAVRKFLFAQAPQPYIVVADDIQKTGGASASFDWLLHTAKDNTITMGPGAGEFHIQGPGAGSAVCFVKFLAPATGLAVAESDLSGQTFVRRDGTYYYDRFFKEIHASYSGTNPKFAAILVAAESLADLPTIETTQTLDGLVVEITFSDGMKDQVTITDNDMDFVREKPAGPIFMLIGNKP